MGLALVVDLTSGNNRGLAIERMFQDSTAMNHRDNGYCILAYLIDDSITVSETLSNGLVVYFGNYSAREGKSTEQTGAINNLCHDC